MKIQMSFILAGRVSKCFPHCVNAGGVAAPKSDTVCTFLFWCVGVTIALQKLVSPLKVIQCPIMRQQPLLPSRQPDKTLSREPERINEREAADEPVGEEVQCLLCLSHTAWLLLFSCRELNRQLSSCYLSTFLHISQYIGHIARSLFPSAFDFSFTAALSFNSKGAFSDVDKLKEAQIWKECAH